MGRSKDKRVSLVSKQRNFHLICDNFAICRIFIIAKQRKKDIEPVQLINYSKSMNLFTSLITSRTLSICVLHRAAGLRFLFHGQKVLLSLYYSPQSFRGYLLIQNQEKPQLSQLIYKKWHQLKV